MLIFAAGTRLLREKQDLGDPAGAMRRGGSRTARAALCAWSCNQQASLAQSFTKKEHALKERALCYLTSTQPFLMATTTA
jgi:hypothetical protein